MDEDCFIKEGDSPTIKLRKIVKKKEPRDKITVFRMLPTPKINTHRLLKPHPMNETNTDRFSMTNKGTFLTGITEKKEQHKHTTGEIFYKTTKGINADISAVDNLPTTVQASDIQRKLLRPHQSTQTLVSKVKKKLNQTPKNSVKIGAKKCHTPRQNVLNNKQKIDLIKQNAKSKVYQHQRQIIQRDAMERSSIRHD
jgi:hypothetical protein